MTEEKEDTPKKSIALGLKRIVTSQFSFIEPTKEQKENLKIENLKINYNGKLGWSIEKKIIGVILDFEFIFEPETSPLLTAQTVTEFNAEGNVEDLKMEAKTINLPDDILAVILGTAYSTARGIIYSRTLGSFLNQFYLPLIPTSTLLGDFKKVNLKKDSKETKEK